MSYEARLRKIKQIPHTAQLIIYGYMRHTQIELHLINQSVYYNIPDLVRLCVSCYYHQFTYFGKCATTIEISGVDKNIATLTKATGTGRSVYCNEWIHSMCNKLITCKMKIDHNYAEHMILIGITSNDNNPEQAFLYESKQFSYCMQNAGNKWKNDVDKRCDMEYGCYDGVSTESGDIITLTLDLSKHSISFAKNGVSAGICYDDIVRKKDLYYKIAVAMYVKDDSVTIVDYSEIDQ
eukprot:61631_1